MPQDDAVARARALLGTPFRLHGRSADTGVDCVGLIVLAMCPQGDVPTGYALRNTDEARWISALDSLAKRVATDPAPPGATLLMKPGPSQFHLGIWSGNSLIHADTRLQRVAERPGTPPWSILGAWIF
jgi:murein DD-endopeptidase / murein LD-carboxypeptidase